MSFTKRKVLVISLVFLLVTPSLVLVAQDEGTGQNQSSQDQPTVVATVNGAELTQQELSRASQVRQIYMYAIQQQQQQQQCSRGCTLPQRFVQFLVMKDQGRKFLQEYQQYVLDQLIDQELQKQKIEEFGIKAAEEEVQKQIDEIINQNDQFEDEKSLEEFLKNNQNMSLDDFKSLIRENKRNQKLREKVTGGVEVSKEEISSFYEENKGSYTDDEGNVKPLEEVRSQIEETLRSRKSSEAWSQWLTEVREEAKIEKKLENL